MRKIIIGILSLFILTGCSQAMETDQTIESSADLELSADLSNESQKKESTERTVREESAETSERLVSKENNKMEPIPIEVMDSSGNILKETYDSFSAIDLNRPNALHVNEVFTGWQETDTIDKISDETLCAEDNMTLTMDSINIAEVQNAIYNDAVYIHNDTRSEFSVPIHIGGQAEFCVLDLEIEYDPNVIVFSSIENADADATCHCVADENKIYISFVCTGNVYADVELCDIQFQTTGHEKMDTALKYTVSDIAAWDNETGSFYSVNYELIPGKIVMY